MVYGDAAGSYTGASVDLEQTVQSLDAPAERTTRGLIRQIKTESEVKSYLRASAPFYGESIIADLKHTLFNEPNTVLKAIDVTLSTMARALSYAVVISGAYTNSLLLTSVGVGLYIVPTTKQYFMLDEILEEVRE